MDGHRLIHTNGTLLLRAVKAEDSGYYTCTATNTGGFDTIIVNLLVQGKAPEDRGLPSLPSHLGDRPFVEQRCHVDEEAGGMGRMSRSWGSTKRAGKGGEGQAWALSCSWDSPCSHYRVLTLCGEAWWLSPHSSPGPAPPHCL